MVPVNRIKYFHCLADGFQAPFDVSKEKKPLDKILSGPHGGLCPVNVDSVATSCLLDLQGETVGLNQT